MLPLLITVCTAARLEAPMAILAFVKALCSPTVRYSDQGYNLCMFEAAVAHLVEMHQKDKRKEYLQKLFTH